MNTSSRGLNRRKVLQAAVAGAMLAPLPTLASVCRGPQPRPDGELAYSDFGVDSTAEEVTEGVNLTGKTVLVTGCHPS